MLLSAAARAVAEVEADAGLLAGGRGAAGTAAQLLQARSGSSTIAFLYHTVITDDIGQGLANVPLLTCNSYLNQGGGGICS